MKDHGEYVEVNVDADNAKGHISLDVCYDKTGKVECKACDGSGEVED